MSPSLRRPLALCFAVLTAAIPLLANEDVRGIVAESGERKPLPGVTLRLVSMKDSTKIMGAVSDRDGEFEIEDVPKGAWKLKASFVGYRTEERTVFVRNSTVELGTVLLTSDTVALRGIEVTESVVAVEMKGDTVEFNAGAFKTNPYGSAEDLVKKMPGIQVQGGQVTAQGENVQRVLVDGRRFFGDDASGTLKNVPADMVDKVQVYDAQNDQARFSGVDDGNTEKTLNLITKKDKRSGQFGKYYGGYGTDDRWSGGASHNYFDGAQRITLLGLTNNINQQNFSISDILASMGVGGSMGRMMSGWASRAGASNMLRMSGGGGFSDLFVDEGNGITTTHMLGTNMSFELADGVDLDGSYLFNYADNDNGTVLDRDYVQPAGQTYNELSESQRLQRTHRLNLRLDAEIDSVNSILFTPRVTYQNGDNGSTTQGITANGADTLSGTNNLNTGVSQGSTVGGDLTYRHRFAPGRVLALNAGINWNNGLSDGSLNAQNAFLGVDSVVVIDQTSFQSSNSLRLDGMISYTEPMRDKDVLQFEYRPQITRSASDKRTSSYDPATGDYTIIEPALTNAFDNSWMTHTAEVSYRAEFGDAEITPGVAYQYAELSSENTFPSTTSIFRSYNNILPTFQWRQKFSLASDLRVGYRTSISPPSSSQLQNVVDNSNPVQLRLGNPDLEQTYTHSVWARFRDINWMAGKTLFGFVSASYTQDYIGTESVVTTTDTVVAGQRIPPGAQITRPVNLQGAMNVRSFLTYGFKVGFLESNLNLNGGVTYGRTPGLVNGVENISNNTGMTGGLFLSTNISEDIDASVSYNGTYNIVINTLQRQNDANYFVHSAGARLIWNLGPVACSTDVTQSLYTGLGEGFDRSFTVWNAGVGYRFLAEQQAELRLTVFDILRQNNALNRNINDIYVESTRTTQLLTQYFMLTFSYDLRSFTGAPPQQGGFGPPGMRRR